MNGNKQPDKVLRQPRHSQKLHQAIAREISFKLILSWIIALGAIASIFKLLPYHLSQKSKLKELEIQVQETDARVSKLRDELNRNFDPQQTQNLIKQYSTLTNANQSRIYWLKDEDVDN